MTNKTELNLQNLHLTQHAGVSEVCTTKFRSTPSRRVDVEKLVRLNINNFVFCNDHNQRNLHHFQSTQLTFPATLKLCTIITR